MEDNKHLKELLESDEKMERTELAPGLTVEEIRALFFDKATLREPPYKVYQLNQEGHRYYYRFEDGEPVLYPSVTTLIAQTMPTNYGLLEWIKANGQNADTLRDLAAAYGTFMHAQFERLIIGRRYDFAEVPALLREYMDRENLPESFYFESMKKIKKDVLAFAQFLFDWKVRPLAIEIGLVHPEYHYAGCIDMPCIMTDPKTGEEFTAIVDFKSGRKGFYEDHEIQLHLYKPMWEVNFPEFPVSRVFNFSPKDWRKAPSYNLKDQTGSKNAEKIPHLLALAAIEDEKRDNILTVVHGELNLDTMNIGDCYAELSLAKLIQGDFAKPEEAEKPAKTPRKSTKSEKTGDLSSEPKKARKTKKTAKLNEAEIEAASADLFEEVQQLKEERK